MSLTLQSQLFEKLFSTAEMTANFSDESYSAKLVLVESALAKVQAELAVIPEDAALSIRQKLASFDVDLAKLSLETEKSSIPTIELLRQLREQVGGEAASFIHWGATSQDIMDTAVVLQVKEGLELLEVKLQRTLKNLAYLADKHKTTLMAGRTHSQQALPLSFGFKVANWLVPLLRHKERLDELKKRLFVVQFGGAVGTLASLGERGILVQEALAKELELSVPLTPWHTQRDTFAELASWLSLLTGSLAKMSQDIILLAQSEIAELRESADPTRGGSSTLPQKSNPVQSELIIAAARQNAQLLATMHQAMIQEHERATHGWQLEWLALPQMFQLSASALEKALWLSEHLLVDEAQMQANIQASKGSMLAEYYSFELAKYLPKGEAKALVKEAVMKVSQTNKHLADILAELSNAPVDWSSKKDEAEYLGQAYTLVERVLEKVKYYE